jgi:hypothetical protein
MNERIRELADQARFVDTLEYPHQDVIFEKFAELIVKECIEQAKPNMFYPTDGTWIEKSYWEGRYDSAEQIREHFGVK